MTGAQSQSPGELPAVDALEHVRPHPPARAIPALLPTGPQAPSVVSGAPPWCRSVGWTRKKERKPQSGEQEEGHPVCSQGRDKHRCVTSGCPKKGRLSGGGGIPVSLPFNPESFLKTFCQKGLKIRFLNPI